MNWFNYYGLLIISALMLPNTIFAIKHKDGFENKYKNKAVVIMEQIGRYGCMFFMIFNIPYTYFNLWFEHALIVYLWVNAVLCSAYLTFWFICRNKNGKLRALSLSIIPSVIFLFSGVVVANIPLVVFAVLFGINHILLSYKNFSIATTTSDVVQ